MKTIMLNDATYRALADLAILPFHSTATRQRDGTWLVPVDEEVYQRLQEIRLPGESDDDIVMRMIRSYTGAKPS